MPEEPLELDVRRVDGPPDHYLDAAERLERVVDVQIATLNGIDEKAEHVTRLVGILLGVVLSVVSLVVRFGDGAVTSATPATVAAFGVGVTGLVLSMGFAIVTYLRSRVEPGIHQNVGLLLSREQYAVLPEVYVRRVLGTYGHSIGKNKQVINRNAKRFRWTLTFLLIGVAYLSLSAVLLVVWAVSSAGMLEFTAGDARAVGLWTTLVIGAVVVYILSGSYLTLGSEGGHNDR